MSHFALCTAALAVGVIIGRGIYMAYGGQALLPAEGSFLPGFLRGFYWVLLPVVLMGTFSVTLYAVPVAIGVLAFRSAFDSYYVWGSFSTQGGVVADAALLQTFVIAVHVFYTYAFFLLALRCVHYRCGVKGRPNDAGTMLGPFGRCFIWDYFSVAGVLTLCGIFSYTVLYFC